MDTSMLNFIRLLELGLSSAVHIKAQSAYDVDQPGTLVCVEDPHNLVVYVVSSHFTALQHQSRIFMHSTWKLQAFQVDTDATFTQFT